MGHRVSSARRRSQRLRSRTRITTTKRTRFVRSRGRQAGWRPRPEKGISAVIAIVLLLAITIAITGTAFIFIGRSFTAAGEGAEAQAAGISSADARFSIEAVAGNNVTIRNLGNQTLQGLAFYLDGGSINASGSSVPAGGTARYTLAQAELTPFAGKIAELRVTGPANSRDRIAVQFEGTTATAGADVKAPVVYLTSPNPNSEVSGSVNVAADAADNRGVVGVQFMLDGGLLLAEDTTYPYSVSWTTTGSSNGPHQLSARARDAAANSKTSAVVNVSVFNLPASKLVLSYPLSEVSGALTLDRSGFNNTGNLSGGPTWTSGRFGNGLSFDGMDDIVQAEPTRSLNLTNFTVSFWIYPRQTKPDWQPLISKQNTGGTARNFAFFIVPNTMQLHISLYDQGCFSGYAFNSAASLPMNAWTYVAITYDQSFYRSYFNGALDNSMALTVIPCRNNHPLKIGRELGTYTPFNGNMDEIRIYQQALSQAEIISDMNTPIESGPDSISPTVVFTAPSPGANVSSVVTISANASDNIGIAGVTFKRDGSVLGSEDTIPPYSVSWNTVPETDGLHTLSAVARDTAGNNGTTSIPVSVTRDTTPPTVAILAPVNGSVVVFSVGIAASASDSSGIAGVTFKVNDSTIGAEDLFAPYSTFWSASVPDGWYTLTAVARDTAGNNATSAPVMVEVDNVDTTPPTIFIDRPLANATISGVVNYSAIVTDNRGTFGLRVQFFLDGVLLQEDFNAPFLILWNTSMNATGVHQLQATAIDVSANSQNSAIVTVTIVRDTENPAVTITSPAANAVVNDTIWLRANATDTLPGTVIGVQFALDGFAFGAEDTTLPYEISWNTRSAVNGNYTVRATARDSGGNTNFTQISLRVANYPIISSVAVDGIYNSSASVSWMTDRIADSAVSYGTTTAYGNVLYDPPLVLDHSLGISDLQPDTTYYYKITSTGSDGISSNYTGSFHTSIAGFSAVRIDSGSTTPSWLDYNEKEWKADAGFTAGSITTTTSPIGNTIDDVLYQTGRLSMTRYRFSVPNGQRVVTLKFSDSWLLPGQRIFNVFINGQPVLTNFDIAATAGGQNLPVDRQFAVGVPLSGRIDIVFGSLANAPLINAIEIL